MFSVEKNNMFLSLLQYDAMATPRYFVLCCNISNLVQILQILGISPSGKEPKPVMYAQIYKSVIFAIFSPT